MNEYLQLFPKSELRPSSFMFLNFEEVAGQSHKQAMAPSKPQDLGPPLERPLFKFYSMRSFQSKKRRR